VQLSNFKLNWGMVAGVLGGIIIGIAAVWGYVYLQNRPTPPTLLESVIEDQTPSRDGFTLVEWGGLLYE
jgi:hypothetical protein